MIAVLAGMFTNYASAAARSACARLITSTSAKGSTPASIAAWCPGAARDRRPRYCPASGAVRTVACFRQLVHEAASRGTIAGVPSSALIAFSITARLW